MDRLLVAAAHAGAAQCDLAFVPVYDTRCGGVVKGLDLDVADCALVGAVIGAVVVLAVQMQRPCRDLERTAGRLIDAVFLRVRRLQRNGRGIFPGVDER